MALSGTLVGPSVRLATDGGGLPIIASDEPEAPDGFRASMAYEERDGAIRQVWSVLPEDAYGDAVKLAVLSAGSLGDEDALSVPQLVRTWYVGESSYGAGDRVVWDGSLYRCLQTHAPRLGSEPDAAPELWERIQQ